MNDLVVNDSFKTGCLQRTLTRSQQATSTHITRYQNVQGSITEHAVIYKKSPLKEAIQYRKFPLNNIRLPVQKTKFSHVAVVVDIDGESLASFHKRSRGIRLRRIAAICRETRIGNADILDRFELINDLETRNTRKEFFSRDSNPITTAL